MNFDCNKTWKFKYATIAKSIRDDIIRNKLDSLAILNVQFNMEFMVSDVCDILSICLYHKMEDYEF